MKLTDYLDQKGETMRGFSRRSGLRVSTISRLVGGSRPHAKTLYRVGKATGGEVGVNDYPGLRED